jgi:hypothetical protein
VAVSLIVDEQPQLPVPQAAVHALGASRVGRLTVIALLTRLGLAGRLADLGWEHRGGWVTAGDEQAHVAMNVNSGGVRFTLRPMDELAGDVAIPDARLEEIARGFLDQLGRPADPLVLERITHLHVQTSSATGELSAVERLDAGLVFRRTVDDLPVIGPGGLAMVRIAADEAVIGGREICRPVTGRGPVIGLRSPESALDELRRRLESRGFEGEATVHRSLFGYEELGIEQVQHRLAPAYAFQVELPGNGVDDKTVEVIPAGQPAVG